MCIVSLYFKWPTNDAIPIFLLKYLISALVLVRKFCPYYEASSSSLMESIIYEGRIYQNLSWLSTPYFSCKRGIGKILNYISCSMRMCEISKFSFSSLLTAIPPKRCMSRSVHAIASGLMPFWFNFFSPFWQGHQSNTSVACIRFCTLLWVSSTLLPRVVHFIFRPRGRNEHDA